MSLTLSESTLGILRNAGSINPGLVVDPGNTIVTKAANETIIMVAKVEEVFESPFAVSNLSQFINALGFVDTPLIEFGETNCVITDKNGGSQSLKYYFSDPSLLGQPNKIPVIPECEVQFDLPLHAMKNIMRASSGMSLKDIVFTNKSGKIQAIVCDTSNELSNNFTVDLAEYDGEHTFSFIVKAINLKMLDGPYHVSLSSRKVAKFEHLGGMDLTYFVALEKDSIFE